MNEADICTKNTDSRTYLSLLPRIMGNDEYMRNADDEALEQGGLLGRIETPNPTGMLDDV